MYVLCTIHLKMMVGLTRQDSNPWIYNYMHVPSSQWPKVHVQSAYVTAVYELYMSTELHMVIEIHNKS